MIHIQNRKAQHEADLKNKDKAVQDKETELNRHREFLDAFNVIFLDELKQKKGKERRRFQQATSR
jgi:hypothetical protein